MFSLKVISFYLIVFFKSIKLMFRENNRVLTTVNYNIYLPIYIIYR